MLDAAFVDDVAKGTFGNVGDLLAKHLIKPLHRCRICLTGFDVEEVEDIRRGVESLGGTINLDLTEDCSLLVVHEQCQLRGNVKLKYARTWSIPIVKHAWLMMCIQEQFLVEMADFLIGMPEDELEIVEREEATISSTSQITKTFFKNAPFFVLMI